MSLRIAHGGNRLVVPEINQCVFLRLSVLFFRSVCCSVCCFTSSVGIFIFPVGILIFAGAILIFAGAIFKEEP